MTSHTRDLLRVAAIAYGRELDVEEDCTLAAAAVQFALEELQRVQRKYLDQRSASEQSRQAYSTLEDIVEAYEGMALRARTGAPEPIPE